MSMQHSFEEFSDKQRRVELKYVGNFVAKTVLVESANQFSVEEMCRTQYSMKYFFRSHIYIYTNMYSTLSSVFTNFYSYKNPMGDSLALQTVSESFVHTELLKLNTSKSTGLDEIPSKFIKEGADIVQFPITHIINLSILTNTVPRDMETARVRPIFKKNSPLEASNYRPVSILSVVSKILERSVYEGHSETNAMPTIS